jgi:hypothetical protein
VKDETGSRGYEMKRRRLHVQLSEKQQVILAVLLVVLVATSLLYCLGLASIVLRQNWESAPIPWNGSETLEEMDDLTPPLVPTEPSDATVVPF